MARILIGWELGHGMGHVMPLRMIARHFLDAGHELAFVVRDLVVAEKLLADLPVTCYPAPLLHTQSWELGRTDCFSQLLANVGLADQGKLAAGLSGWLTLMDKLAPDAALLEFAPTAMLACHIRNIPFAIQGNGFYCPPSHTDGFGIMNQKLPEPERLGHDERVRQCINAVLAEQGATPLETLADLYRLPSLTLLATFAELDHFPDRGEADYYGVWVPREGEPPVWPETKGPKVFAYLVGRPDIEPLLKMLSQSGLPTLIFLSGLPDAARKRYSTASCAFVDRLLDLRQLASEADLGVFHGNHSSTAIFLQAGTPTLQIPLYMEQMLFARRVRACRAGEIATLDNPKRIAEALNVMLSAPVYRQEAGEFAARYREHDMEQSTKRAAQRFMRAVLSMD